MDYKPKHINDIFEGEFVECKNEKTKKSSMKLNLCHQQIVIKNVKCILRVMTGQI